MSTRNSILSSTCLWERVPLVVGPVARKDHTFLAPRDLPVVFGGRDSNGQLLGCRECILPSNIVSGDVWLLNFELRRFERPTIHGLQTLL